MIVIVDYQMGNVGSIVNMLKKLGVDARVSADVDTIRKAVKLIIPGVGAFDSGMSNIARLGLIDVLNFKAIEERTPTLGICLGMQLMTRLSSEGQSSGLGWVDAEATRFVSTAEQPLKVPHMGWNTVSETRPTELMKGMDALARFYFVHSYYVSCVRREDVMLRATYGIEFDAAFHKDNIIGVQFHPEKSHKWGMQLFRNFVERY